MRVGYFLRKKINQSHQLGRRLTYLAEYSSWFLFSFAKFKKNPIFDGLNKILIINIGALGDVFCSIKTAYALKTKYPSKEISLLIPDNLLADVKFLEKSCNINIICEKDLEKNTKFDITFLFTLYSQFKKYKEKFGFSIGNEYSSIADSMQNLKNIFLNRKIFPIKAHKFEQEFKILKKAGFYLDFKDYLIPKIEIKTKLKKDFVVLHASGKHFSKIFSEGKIPAYAWPLERFSQVADYLINEKNLDVILTGSLEESFINEKIISSVKSKRIHNLAGKLNIAELASLVSQAKLLLSIDTSLVHIGELTNTPLIVLHGAGFPEVNGAYGNKNQINIFHPKVCVKCRRKAECPEKENICMNSISIQEVKKAVNLLLK